MTQDHAKRLEKFARGLFATMTAEQGAVLIDMLSPFDPHRSLAVLKVHAKNHEYLSLKNLKFALIADDAQQRIGRQTALQQRKVDWIRETERTKGYEGLEDYAVIHAHYAECWNQVEACTADHAGKQGVRRMIRGHAKAAGFEIGLDATEAQELADACIRLAPGEVIPRVEFFNPIPSEEDVASRAHARAQASKANTFREFAGGAV